MERTVYLYVKRCPHCGLMYFGMTVRNPFIYMGSGIKWINHLKHYGVKPQTIEVWGFDTRADARAFALAYSNQQEIVQSSQWANLTEENVFGEYHTSYVKTPEHRANLSKAVRAAYAAGKYEGLKRKRPIWTEEMRAERSRKYKGRKLSSDAVANIQRGRERWVRSSDVFYDCKYCGQTNITKKHHTRSFCNKSCAAKFNNLKRG